MEFEWDDAKANTNEQKHGVSFPEAATVFGDPLAITFYDPDHSDDEDRYLSIGLSAAGRVILLSHTDRDEKIRIISAREATRSERKGTKMGPSRESGDDEVRPEYDLTQLRGGVRGKYHQRYQSRLHLVRLAPEVAAAFPTEEAVNQALRLLLQIARQQVTPPTAS